MPEPDKKPDRRARPRRRCRASFCRLLGSPAVRVEVRDITRWGIGLLCPGPLRPGEVVTLQLGGRRLGLAAALRARVAWSERRRDGRWEAGCVFDPALPHPLIQSLQ
jgi:hypothetical protein